MCDDMTQEQEKLIEDNIKLVSHTFKTYFPNVVVTEDLYQEACIGLIKAASKWEPQKGVFSTIACWTIRTNINGAITSNTRQKRRPTKENISIDSNLKLEDGMTVGESLITCDDSFEESLLQSQIIYQSLDILNERERKIIEQIYFDGISSTQIAIQLEITKSRVNQIRKVALSKMKDFIEG